MERAGSMTMLLPISTLSSAGWLLPTPVKVASGRPVGLHMPHVINLSPFQTMHVVQQVKVGRS